VFVTGKHLKPGLLLVGEAKSLPLECRATRQQNRQKGFPATNTLAYSVRLAARRIYYTAGHFQYVIIQHSLRCPCYWRKTSFSLSLQLETLEEKGFHVGKCFSIFIRNLLKY
jgi:hypothetical protein